MSVLDTPDAAVAAPTRGLPRWLKRVLAFLAILGPGLIAANAGNDAGGILTYASAGAQFGYRTLFLMVLITVALIVVQEMCSRLGAYTGEGVGAPMELLGVSRYIAVPLALLAIWAVTALGDYGRAERVFLAMGLVFLS